MKKNLDIKFIYNGNITKANIVYSKHLFNKIPIYYSADIQGIIAIKLEREKIFVIVNKDSLQGMSDNDVKTNILHKVLDIEYNNSYISDFCTAKLISYSSTKKFVNTFDRSNKIEDCMRNTNLKPVALEKLLDSIDFEEVI